MKTDDARMYANLVGIAFEEAELRITALMIAQRDRFELAFATNSGGRSTVESVRARRTTDTKEFDYCIQYPHLRGAWHGWKAHDRLSGNDPFVGFILEAANEGELAAHDAASDGMMSSMHDVLNDAPGQREGVGHPDWQKLKERVYVLLDKAARYDWIEAQKGLELRTLEVNVPWFRENGQRFSPTHMVCAGGTQFAPQDSLDATIDCARAVQNARK